MATCLHCGKIRLCEEYLDECTPGCSHITNICIQCLWNVDAKCARQCVQCSRPLEVDEQRAINMLAAKFFNLEGLDPSQFQPLPEHIEAGIGL